MILEEETKEAFGYNPSDLPRGSEKSILTACELCGIFRIPSKNDYRTFCKSCSLKGNTRALGLKLSDTTKALMSTAKKGQVLTEVHKARISASLVGDKHPMFGKHFSEAHKSRIGTAATGDKNPNWRGGLSFGKYCEKFNNAYKQLVRCRFNNKCFLCGITTEENGRALDVHHVNYNKDCDCDNTKCVCVPLCRRCHSRTNSNREYWEERIMIALKNTLLG